jgi:hypothetical protein
MKEDDISTLPGPLPAGPKVEHLLRPGRSFIKETEAARIASLSLPSPPHGTPSILTCVHAYPQIEPTHRSVVCVCDSYGFQRRRDLMC